MRSSPQVGFLVRHLYDQFLQLGRNSRPSSGFRFPPPKQPKAFPMPSDEGIRLDNSQSLSPRKQTGKQYQSEPASITRSAGPDLALQVQSQLLAEKKVLSGQSTMGPQAEPDEPQGIQQ